MTATRRSLALSAAAVALAAVPAAAHPDGQYDYAHPAPDGPVVFDSDPVVQPLPHDAPMAADEVYERELVEERYPEPHAALPLLGYPHAGYPQGPGAYGAAYPHHAGAGPMMPARFDRESWLDQCNDRIRGVKRKDRAGVIGGLLGAVAGGVIGNRAWGSERLAGTLLGGGVGALAGLAIGSAVGAAGERRREDDCAWHLDRYMADYGGPGYGQQGYGQPGYSYGYPGYGQGHSGYGYGYGGYMMVPVLVAVPQRQVVRETVTEEWVDVPVRERTVARTRTIHRPAPAPDKRIKYIKGN